MPDGNYNLFNGRRTADQYVKGYLKGVLAIAGVTSALVCSIGTWAVLKIIDIDSQVQVIKTTSATVESSGKLKEAIGDLKVEVAKLTQGMHMQNKDLDEIKGLLRRSTPYEMRRVV